MGAYAYADLIDRLLNTCEYLEVRPGFQSNVQIPQDRQDSFFWKEKFLFRDNKILTVADGEIFDENGDPSERTFAYDFRERGSNQPLFRVCNHNSRQSVNEPCHVHVDHDDNVVECFPTSKGKDFAYIIHCIKNYYLGKRQDWDDEDSDAASS